jgi:hypothetical protein
MVGQNWSTPRAEEKKQHNSADNGMALSAQVTDWQTPSAGCAEAGATSRSGDRKGELLLGGQARQWPTPAKRDEKSIHASAKTMERNSRPLSEVAGQAVQANPSTIGKLRGSLNSAWVRSLLGWPDEYWNALEEATMEYHLTAPRAARTKASCE